MGCVGHVASPARPHGVLARRAQCRSHSIPPAPRSAFDVTADVEAFLSGTAGTAGGPCGHRPARTASPSTRRSPRRPLCDRCFASPSAARTRPFVPPSAYANDGASAYEDTYISLQAPDLSRGSLDHIMVGSDGERPPGCACALSGWDRTHRGHHNRERDVAPSGPGRRIAAHTLCREGLHAHRPRDGWGCHRRALQIDAGSPVTAPALSRAMGVQTLAA